MSRGIDYTKWDHFEDDESEDERPLRTPQVTKLTRPTQVTWQPDGSIALADPMDQDSNNDGEKEEDENRQTRPAVAKHVSGSSTSTPRKIEFRSANNFEQKEGSVSASSTNWEGDWTRQGGVVTLPESMGTVASGSALYWTQDRATVTIRWHVPPVASVFGTSSSSSSASSSTQPKLSLQVQLTGGVSYRERNHTVMSAQNNNEGNSGNSPTLLVYHNVNNQTILLWQADLPYQIHYDEDDDDEIENQQHYVDWSVEVGPNEKANEKFLRVTWNKAVPMEGMILWWKRPLVGVPEVNVDVPRRSGTQESSTFQDNWNQAHEQFKAKIAQQKEQKQQHGIEQEQEYDDDDEEELS